MGALTIGAIFVALTIAYLIGVRRGRKQAWRQGYAEGWRKRERYGNGGRRQWTRPKGWPRRI